MKRVVILQEYVPQYRVPFFELLHEEAKNVGIDVSVAYGEVGAGQATRNDARDLHCAIRIRQREWRIAGRRVVIRDTSDAIVGSDMIILEQARRNLDAYKVLMTKGGTGPLVALWGHGKDYTRKTTGVESRLARWLTSKADWFFAYTLGGRDHVVAEGFPAGKISVVQNSIDSRELRESLNNVLSEELAQFSSTYNLLGRTALFMGALDPSKRLPFLFRSSQRVHSRNPDFRLLIAGDGELRAVVEEWARTNSWVTYLGNISGGMKAIALSASQVLAIPGRVGLIAVDSFAAEVPIITTNWDWHAPEFEYLNDGQNALVAMDDSDAFGDALLSVLGDDELLCALRKGAKESGSFFTIEKMVDNFLQGIRAALATRQL